MTPLPTPATDFRCPGENYSIPRAVHLGRLAEYYPPCRQCMHRRDARSLPAPHARHWAEVEGRHAAASPFHAEGVGGMAAGDLAPADVQRIARAFARILGQGAQASDSPRPVVVLGGDGRPQTAPFVAAVSEAIRWTGSPVVDIGAASSPCLAAAIAHIAAAERVPVAGLLVGNPGSSQHAVGLKFWAAANEPLSQGPRLDEIERLSGQHLDRPTRTFGSLRHYRAAEDYLAAYQPAYHAMRPLRFVLACASLPAQSYLAGLTAHVACRVIECSTIRARLGEQVLADGAHFGIAIDDDGEVCRLWDEQGRPVPIERLLLVLVPPGARVVLEGTSPTTLLRALQARGCRVATSSPLRELMAQTMQQEEAIIGGGPSGRLWYADGDVPLADALATLTLLLSHLSRSDRSLSQVLEQAPALE